MHLTSSTPLGICDGAKRSASFFEVRAPLTSYKLLVDAGFSMAGTLVVRSRFDCNLFKLPLPPVNCCSSGSCMVGPSPTGRLSYTSVGGRIAVGSVRCSPCRRPIGGGELAPCVSRRRNPFDMRSSNFFGCFRVCVSPQDDSN
jgi:hypothetical protein